MRWSKFFNLIIPIFALSFISCKGNQPGNVSDEICCGGVSKSLSKLIGSTEPINLQELPNAFESPKPINLQELPNAFETFEPINFQELFDATESPEPINLQELPNAFETFETLNLQELPDATESLEPINFQELPNAFETFEILNLQELPDATESPEPINLQEIQNDTRSIEPTTSRGIIKATYLTSFPNYIPFFSARFGDGRSYEKGYQSVGFYSLFLQTAYQHLFVDLQLMRVDLGRYACSYGIGWRVFSKDYFETVGINVFYDARHYLKNLFNQVGLGIELFSKCWDFRVNGYLPFGTKESFETSSTLDFGDGYLATNHQKQSAMWGLDLEFGTEFCLWNCRIFYLGLGPYFYNTFASCACDSNAILGGMARGCFYWNRCIEAAIFVSHDPFFKTKVQLELTLNFPSCCVVCPRMKVQRNRIITTRKTCCWSTNY